MTSAEPLSPSDAHQLDSALKQLVAGRGTVGWRAIDSTYIDALTASEALLVERAVASRRAEFATGRSLLRSLLADDVEILRTDTRAPRFPSGSVGSLSHDAGIALGVVAPASQTAAVGVDVELHTALSEGMQSVILRSDDVAPDALTAFVTKEAAYKAWSSLGGGMLEHHDVQVTIDDTNFSALLNGERSVNGELVYVAGRVVACVFVPLAERITVL